MHYLEKLMSLTQELRKDRATASSQQSRSESPTKQFDIHRGDSHKDTSFDNDIDEVLLNNPGLRCTLSFGTMELELSTTDPVATKNSTVLASLQASNVYICYCSLGKAHMDVQVTCTDNTFPKHNWCQIFRHSNPVH